jgi:hypothetical protein
MPSIEIQYILGIKIKAENCKLVPHETDCENSINSKTGGLNSKISNALQSNILKFNHRASFIFEMFWM